MPALILKISSNSLSFIIFAKFDNVDEMLNLAKKRGVSLIPLVNQDNEVINKTRGYVRAKSVVDNRQNIVNVDESGEQVINEFDPSTFVQVHGIGISPRDVMIESVDFGLLVNPYIAFGAYNSFGADIMYRVPNTLNIYAGLTLDVSGAGEESTANFWTDNFGVVLASTKTILIQAGLGGKIDMYVANGNFRLTPKIAGIYNLAQFISEDPTSMNIIETLIIF